ncbi:MAG: acylphosphatase [Victivallaceae bacterium]|jgi:acylphosphatase
MGKAFHIIIEGRVTGVGFRYLAMDYAEQFSSLKGYIRNIGYGQVEAVVQGEPDEVEQMVQWLRRGPDSARVDQFRINPVPLSDTLDSFSIR